MQTKAGRASPPLPRIGRRRTDYDLETTVSSRRTSRATPLPRIGLRRLGDVVRRAPLPRLGLRVSGQRRSLPLPRIGRRPQLNTKHWNLEPVFFRIHYRGSDPVISSQPAETRAGTVLYMFHWNLENDSSVRRAGQHWSTVVKKRPVHGAGRPCDSSKIDQHFPGSRN